MSKIVTRSMFFYGTEVTLLNRSLDFDEGSGEIQATLLVGDYTATELAAEVARAMNEAGGQVYTASFNRSTGILTISATSNFSLLCNSGSRVGTSIWVTIGFSTAVDRTASNSYASNTRLGKKYETQHPVSEYTSPDDSFVKESSAVTVSANGVTQLVSYGDGARVEMNIRLITNKLSLLNSPFLNNASGVADFKTFVQYILKKTKVEFMPDVSTPATYYNLILEATKEERNGTAFKLKNMKTPDVYESGVLVFREVIQ